MGHVERIYKGELHVTKHVDADSEETFFAQAKPKIYPYNAILIARALIDQNRHKSTLTKREQKRLEIIVNHLDLFVRLCKKRMKI